MVADFRYRVRGLVRRAIAYGTGVSLKVRLWVVFTVLAALAGASSGFLVYRQHRVALRAEAFFLREHEERGVAVSLRELLTELDHGFRRGEVDPGAIERFRIERARLQGFLDDSDEMEMLGAVNRRFDEYLEALAPLGTRTSRSEVVARAGRPETRRRYEEALASVVGFMDLNEGHVFRIAEGLKREQEEAERGQPVATASAS